MKTTSDNFNAEPPSDPSDVAPESGIKTDDTKKMVSPTDPPASGLLPFDTFTWEGRTHEPFRQENGEGFTGITRTELIGKTGASTAFDLRYFEIEPGGYSSFEKHRHEHVIIGVRGSGILIKNGKRLTIHPHDIGYIGPLEPHQLQNLTGHPFGFYCIVDHHRDRPQPVDPEDFS